MALTVDLIDMVRSVVEGIQKGEWVMLKLNVDEKERKQVEKLYGIKMVKYYRFLRTGRAITMPSTSWW